MRNQNSLWAIEPSAIPRVIAMLTGQATQSPETQGQTATPANGRVAVIPIHGLLTNDGPAWYGRTINPSRTPQRRP